MPTDTSSLRSLINLILDARGSHASIVGTEHDETSPAAYGTLVFDLVSVIAGISDLPAKVDELDGQALGEATAPLANRVGLDDKGSKAVLGEIVGMVESVFKATVDGLEATIKTIESAQGGGAAEAAPAPEAEPAEAAKSEPEAAAPEAAAPEAKPEAAPAAEAPADSAPAPEAEAKPEAASEPAAEPKADPAA